MKKRHQKTSASRILLTSVLAVGVAACGGDETSEAQASDAPEDAEEAPEAVATADETAYGFDDIDLDGDSELDANEFHEWSEGPVFAYYMQTDLIEDPDAVDQTGALDEVVFIDALYEAWDVNADGTLDRAEWDAATRVMESLSDTEAAWIEFDIDENGVIGVEEVHTRLEDEDVLAGIDTDEDGVVEGEELDAWFFAAFDIDDSGAVSRDEWRLAEQYFDVPIL